MLRSLLIFGTRNRWTADARRIDESGWPRSSFGRSYSLIVVGIYLFVALFCRFTNYPISKVRLNINARFQPFFHKDCLSSSKYMICFTFTYSSKINVNPQQESFCLYRSLIIIWSMPSWNAIRIGRPFGLMWYHRVRDGEGHLGPKPSSW